MYLTSCNFPQGDRNLGQITSALSSRFAINKVFVETSVNFADESKSDSIPIVLDDAKNLKNPNLVNRLTGKGIT